jgi:transketolase C-terminal domain/subunit
MKQSVSGIVTGSMKIVDSHVVAHYHKKTGQIVHVQSITVFEGGRAVSAEEALQTAHENVAQFGLKPESFGTKLSKDMTHAESPHRINLKTLELVPLDIMRTAVKKRKSKPVAKKKSKNARLSRKAK